MDTNNQYIEDKPKVRQFKYLTEKDIKKKEKEIDELPLNHRISIKDKIIKYYGELRPYITSTKVAKKFGKYLDEDDFDYFYNWILVKEIEIEFKNKTKI